MSDEKYQATKLKAIIQLAARMVQDDPTMADNMDYLWACLVHKVPELADRSKCGSCGRSMKIIVYEADLLDGLLIYAMAKQVRESLRKGIPFTEANKVHIPTLAASNATLKRQTKCDYLGFMKQQENWRGSGYWCLTSWAWKALRGEEVPLWVEYWEGHLIRRSEEKTTLGRMFRTHSDLIKRALEKRKTIKMDHRGEYSDYDPSEWSIPTYAIESPMLFSDRALAHSL